MLSPETGTSRGLFYLDVEAEGAELACESLCDAFGGSIVLERQPGADTAGYAGLEDEVDNHWGAQFKAALLSTLLGVGSQLGVTGTGMIADVITALRRGTSDSMNQTDREPFSAISISSQH